MASSSVPRILPAPSRPMESPPSSDPNFSQTTTAKRKTDVRPPVARAGCVAHIAHDHVLARISVRCQEAGTSKLQLSGMPPTQAESGSSATAMLLELDLRFLIVRPPDSMWPCGLVSSVRVAMRSFLHVVRGAQGTRTVSWPSLPISLVAKFTWLAQMQELSTWQG